MENKDLILVGFVFLACLGIVGYLLINGTTEDTGVKEVVDKYAKYSKQEHVPLSKENGKVNTQELEEKKELGKIAVEYKDKIEKAVNYLNENYKNLIGRDIKFKLYDIDNTKGYVVLYLNATVGNQTGKVLALLSKTNDTIFVGNIIPVKDIARQLNVSIQIPAKNISNVINNMELLLNKKIGDKGKIKLYNYSISNEILTIKFNLTYENRSSIIPIFVTLDGKYLIAEAIPLDLNKKIEPPKPPEPPKQKPIPKTEKPKVEVFVMSYCPFGVQMERALLPVINLFKDKVDFEIKFVDYAMHGKKEIDENLRQYCIQKINKKEYWKYLECFIETGNSTLCLNNISINLSELNKCINETNKEYNISYYRDNTSTYLNGYFPRFLVDEKDNQKYGVQGSPTTFINGVEYVGPRTPEAIKEAICNAFINPPEECKVNLSNKWPSAGIGEGVEARGSCG